MSPPICRALLALAVLLAPAQAGAQEIIAEPKKSDGHAWSQGVSEKDEQLATEAFLEGNRLLKELLVKAAADRYQEALKHWDHPEIHFNLVLALRPLDKPLEILDHLDAIELFGPGALEPEDYKWLERIKAEVGKQIAWVDITCDEPEAVVTMDGASLFTGPGRWSGRVLAGPHLFIATKAGFADGKSGDPLPAGKKTEISLKLYPFKQLTRYQPHFPEWPQWAAFVPGGLAAGSGVYLHYKAYSGFKRFDSGVRDCGGCLPDTALQSLLAGARTELKVAIAADVLGGILLGVGAGLAWMSRLQPYTISPQELEREQAQGRTGILLIPSGAGLTVAGTF